MTTAQTGHVESLYRYPFKGLTAQKLPLVDLTPGHGFPHDRVFALAKAGGGYDATAFRPLPKNRFFALMTDAALAQLDTRYDPETQRFTARLAGEALLDIALSDPDAEARAAQLIVDHLNLSPDQAPHLARGGENRFTDISVVSQSMMNAISLINLDTVQDLAARVGAPVDPLRFRGNLYFSGWSPGSELDLVGKELQVGELRLRVVRRTQRCPATQVNPATADRDLDVPALIEREFGHRDLGIYAEVLSGGRLTPGDPLSVV